MRIVVFAVGRMKERPLREILDDYYGRIRKFAPCDEVEVADPAASKLEQALARQAAQATTIALEIGGRMLDSDQFARELERWGARGKGIVAFVVGGADGIPPGVSVAAHDRISLSRLTFPHRIARLVLVEQIYRASTILRGAPYASH